MSSKRLFVVMMAVCVCSMSMTTGCRSKPKAKIGTEEGRILDPEVVPGDIKLKNWDEFGQRVEGVNLSTVQFEYDSAKIKQSEYPKLEAAATYLKQNSGVRTVLEGHCDERGTTEYNMALGERRSLAVRAHLVGLGIDSARMLTKSYGEEKPLDPGHSAEAWSVNRRVEFALYR